LVFLTILSSKYAALALVGYLVVTFCICFRIRAKSSITYNKDLILYYIRRKWPGSRSEEELAKLAKDKAKIDEGKDKLTKYAAKLEDRRARVAELQQKVDRGEASDDDKDKLGHLRTDLGQLGLNYMVEQVYDDKMVSVEL
jgi:hypothetical protein